MTIWGSFSTSMQALQTHGHAMGQVSSNIANMNTVSYKQVDTHYQTLKNGATPSFTSFSVQPVDIRRVSGQGPISSSVNPYDLAINGQGFFVVNTTPSGSGDTYYTRAGNFSTRTVDLGVDTNGDGVSDKGAALTTQDGKYLMGWLSDGAGGFGSTLVPVVVNADVIAPAKATTSISLSGNVPNNNGSAASYNSSISVVAATEGGAAATRNNIVLNWSKVAGEDNQWTLSLGTSNNDNIDTAYLTPDTVTFNEDGVIDPADASSYRLEITWNDGSVASDITLDLSDMTQYADAGGFTVGTPKDDGYLTGTLVNSSFDQFGVLSAYFSNNTVQPVYKLPLATFAAPDQLTAISGNQYRANNESGAVTLRSINSRNDVGSFVPTALEQSNVNVEDQFTKMIVTQKAYTMASTAFKTADEMTQEVRDMKR
ncbi:flagellar hook protein FlgE [Insolitispirillum peregrinum]|uniref:Flagellar hook protein FlgE n=1 Tax=Insolitispirillum peregrinum TaxID=80876 RepID=A0A1N7NQY6_9PROT|nr:flagellar hook-basal body complex protein [Insolitispirillum peregrinum]SIT00795.1 flagellar hook protein FlgE [Insolitispirillum peregrinum]